ncbi:oleandomycin transport system ATP-binding protein [Natronospira proteinivora]|uniref:Oleandomycin transport system ATP-binding protein n=1 Tax=Natronospira proteinivora TaxID=1807133 RepID=A0ABT1G6T4_9GAMM|nr:ATP-binding cassette domain-containing protein [Natronospira proteinivora]MCP1727011.1 oleandomycin transport system ATP-binding protein [Natronospira proteinivora]
MDAIHAQGVCKHFGATRALEGVDLSVPRGTVLGLLGPNGAGKTTMIRILATLISPDSGQVTINGHDVMSDAHAVRQQIGLTGQYASVDEKLTGMENLVLIARLLGKPRQAARSQARQLLQDFSLEAAGHRAVQTYSGGMRRRLDLAASLVGEPNILFLDEPTTGLDPRARMELWQLIRRLVSAGTTVLLTTQYLEEADALADDIAVIDHGRVIARGSPESLKRRVGEQVLTIRPSQREQLGQVAEILNTLMGREADMDGKQASIAVSDTARLTEVVMRLDAEGIALSDFNLRGASLDDVFLSLTGHPALNDGKGEGEHAHGER